LSALARRVKYHSLHYHGIFHVASSSYTFLAIALKNSSINGWHWGLAKRGKGKRIKDKGEREKPLPSLWSRDWELLVGKIQLFTIAFAFNLPCHLNVLSLARRGAFVSLLQPR